MGWRRWVIVMALVGVALAWAYVHSVESMVPERRVDYAEFLRGLFGIGFACLMLATLPQCNRTWARTLWMVATVAFVVAALSLLGIGIYVGKAVLRAWAQAHMVEFTILGTTLPLLIFASYRQWDPMKERRRLAEQRRANAWEQHARESDRRLVRRWRDAAESVAAERGRGPDSGFVAAAAVAAAAHEAGRETGYAEGYSAGFLDGDVAGSMNAHR